MRDFSPEEQHGRSLPELHVSQDVLDAVIELNPAYVVSRYPDAANGVPAQMYTKKKAEIHLKEAELVMNWVKSRLKS